MKILFHIFSLKPGGAERHRHSMIIKSMVFFLPVLLVVVFVVFFPFRAKVTAFHAINYVGQALVFFYDPYYPDPPPWPATEPQGSKKKATARLLSEDLLRKTLASSSFEDSSGASGPLTHPLTHISQTA